MPIKYHEIQLMLVKVFSVNVLVWRGLGAVRCQLYRCMICLFDFMQTIVAKLILNQDQQLLMLRVLVLLQLILL
jgi:hypothetical protein